MYLAIKILSKTLFIGDKLSIYSWIIYIIYLDLLARVLVQKSFSRNISSPTSELFDKNAEDHSLFSISRFSIFRFFGLRFSISIFSISIFDLSIFDCSILRFFDFRFFDLSIIDLSIFRILHFRFFGRTDGLDGRTG